MAKPEARMQDKEHRTEPRTQEKEVRTAEILKAAREVFFTRGYQNSTVQEIAEKANISKGTVYLYYKGKEDLYVALMVPFLDSLGAAFEDLHQDLEASKYNTGPELFDAICDKFVQLYLTHREGIQVYQAFQIGNLFTELSDETAHTLISRGKNNYALMRRVIQRAFDMGLIREVDVVQVVDIMLGMFLGVIQMEENKLRWTEKDHVASTMRYAFSLFYTGLFK
jgi:TetR/AcrR family transcriptional regulator